jgi:hypothetical protein
LKCTTNSHAAAAVVLVVLKIIILVSLYVKAYIHKVLAKQVQVLVQVLVFVVVVVFSYCLVHSNRTQMHICQEEEWTPPWANIRSGSTTDTPISSDSLLHAEVYKK